jgi:ABC-2 type transport system permease protein
LGITAGYSWLYYPMVVVMLCALALGAAGISSLLVIGVVRLFSARRVAEILGFLGAIMTMICSQSGQLARFENVGSEQAQAAVQLATRYNTPWLPLSWAGRGLVALGQSDWPAALLNLGVTLVLAAGIFAVALVTAERLYYTGWASLQNKGRKRKAPRNNRAGLGFLKVVGLAGTIFPAPVRAVMAKDWLVLRRDLRNLSQLVTPLIIGIVYAFMLLRGGNRPSAEPSDAPVWVLELLQSAQTYASVGLSLFVGWMLLGRLAGMGFSQEGRSYWLLKTSPVSASQQIAAKFLVAYLPTLALSWAYLLVTWLLQRSGISVFLYSLPVIALSIAGNAGVNLTFGITGANMDWEDPRQMQRTGSGCLSALASMIYLPVALLFFFAPPIGLMALGLPETLGQLIGLFLGGGLNLTCAVVPLWLVRKRVDRLGEA